MCEHGRQGVHRRRRGGLTRRDPAATPAPDLVQRRFAPPGPDQLWVADITQQRTDQGWLYLAVVLDAFSRRVVGWSMAEHLRTELVLDALEMAISQRQPPPGLVCHSDHGCQYTSFAYGHRLHASGLVASMGTSGMRWTTPSPRASSPRWNASCSTATPGRPEPGCARRSSISSRSSTTANAATRHSTTPAPSATSSSTYQQHPPPNHRVHESGATPEAMQPPIETALVSETATRSTSGPPSTPPLRSTSPIIRTSTWPARPP